MSAQRCVTTDMFTNDAYTFVASILINWIELNWTVIKTCICCLFTNETEPYKYSRWFSTALLSVTAYVCGLNETNVYTVKSFLLSKAATTPYKAYIFLFSVSAYVVILSGNVV